MAKVVVVILLGIFVVGYGIAEIIFTTKIIRHFENFLRWSEQKRENNDG